MKARKGRRNSGPLGNRRPGERQAPRASRGAAWARQQQVPAVSRAGAMPPTVEPHMPQGEGGLKRRWHRTDSMCRQRLRSSTAVVKVRHHCHHPGFLRRIGTMPAGRQSKPTLRCDSRPQGHSTAARWQRTRAQAHTHYYSSQLHHPGARATTIPCTPPASQNTLCR